MIRGSSWLLAVKGRVCIGPLARILWARAVTVQCANSCRCLFALRNRADLVTLKQLIESGQLRLSSTGPMPLSEAAETVDYIGMRHCRGKSSSAYEGDLEPTSAVWQGGDPPRHHGSKRRRGYRALMRHACLLLIITALAPVRVLYE